MADQALIEAICKTLEQNQTETREGFKRVHERLDQLFEKESVASKDCEARRVSCKACMNSKIEKAQGCPAWMVGVAGIGASLITGMAIFIITMGG